MGKRSIVSLLFVAALAFVVALAACAPAAPPAPTAVPPPPPKAPPTAEPAKAAAPGQLLPPQPVPAEYDKALGNVPMGGGPSGGTFFPITARMAYLINKYGKDAKASASNTGGSVENAKLVGLNEVFFSMVATDVAYYARLGQREFKEAYPDILSSMAGHASLAHMAVNADSPIKDIRDLKGKSIGVGTAGSSNAQAAIEWMSAAGLTDKDVNIKFIAIPDAINGLKDRTIDAAFQMTGPPGAAWTDLTTQHSIRFIGITEGDMKSLSGKFPYVSPAVLNAGVYRGIDQNLPVFGVVNLLATNKKVPDHVVYNVVKIIMENTGELKEGHPQAGEWNIEKAQYAAAIPLHPAAERYYKERGAIK